MRVRIHQNCSHGLYWGQVYNEKQKEWKDVTLSSITKRGAWKKLQKWAKRNGKEPEFEI